MSWSATLWVTLTVARAQTYYLETDPVATRDAAGELADVAAAARCPGEVTRRYVAGQGWRYAFRSDPAEDLALVRSCVTSLGPEDGRVVRLVELVDDRRRVIGVWPSDPAPPPEPAAPVTPKDPRYADVPTDVREIVTRLTRAHAGASGGSREASTLLFRFDRVTPATDDAVAGRIRHTYARRGEDRYLAVEILQGPGTSSKAGVVAGTPWLAGSTARFDAATVRTQLDRFSPEHVLDLASELAAGRLELPERDALYLDAYDEVDGRPAVVLASPPGRDALPVRLYVDVGTWRLAAVEHGVPGSSLRVRYDGWREGEDGSLRPDMIVVTRGTTEVDRVEIRDLDATPTLPSEWFTGGGR